jgi:hypothetical protein
MDIEGKPFSERSLTVATSARDSHTIPFSFPETPGETISLFDGKQRTTAQTNANTMEKANRLSDLSAFKVVDQPAIGAFWTLW